MKPLLAKISQLNKRLFSTQNLASKIGFIGLGQMGSHMANNLIKKSGKDILVYDIDEQKVKEAQSNGGKGCNSIKEIALNSDIIITMLRSDSQVKSVFLDNDNGIINSCKDNVILIDSSTIYFETVREIGNIFKQTKKDVLFFDAPVSGGVPRAKSGELTFMCGNSSSDNNKYLNILSHMGNIFNCGPNHGDGQIVKMCNNLILAISMCGVSEGMNLGINLGMDPVTLAQIINKSTGQCWSSQSYNPVPNIISNIPSSNNYSGGFVVDLMKKDLKLALKASEYSNTQLPLGTNVNTLYDMLSKRNLGNKDFSIIYQFIKGSEQLYNIK